MDQAGGADWAVVCRNLGSWICHEYRISSALCSSMDFAHGVLGAGWDVRAVRVLCRVAPACRQTVWFERPPYPSIVSQPLAESSGGGPDYQNIGGLGCLSSMSNAVAETCGVPVSRVL